MLIEDKMEDGKGPKEKNNGQKFSANTESKINSSKVIVPTPRLRIAIAIDFRRDATGQGLKSQETIPSIERLQTYCFKRITFFENHIP